MNTNKMLLAGLLVLIGCDNTMATTVARFAVTSKSNQPVRIIVDGKIVGPVISQPGANFKASIKVPDQQGGTIELNPMVPDANDRARVNVQIGVVDPATGKLLAGPVYCSAGGQMTTHIDYNPSGPYESSRLRCGY